MLKAWEKGEAVGCNYGWALARLDYFTPVKELPNTLEKTLLVCSEACREVEECLAAAGRSIVKVVSGSEAISCAQRQKFDAAILISTGNEMDLTETVLNLRDVTKTMKIVVVVDGVKEDEEPVRTAARALPNTAVVRLEELRECLRPDGAKIPSRFPAGTGQLVK